MSDPNDVWQDREGSPRRGDDGDRSPRRDRSRSPAAKSNGDRGRAEEGASQNQGNNLHISGLSRSVDEAKLREFFGTIGRPVVKAQIMLDPHSQESRGFGFVMLETGEDAQLAIEKLSGQPLEGKTVTISHAKRGRARTPTPGRYHGVKVESAPRSYGGGYDRPYQPRSYDSRYADRGPPRHDDRERRYDDRRYDDRRYDDRRYEERRSYRDDRDRRDDYYSRDAPRDAGYYSYRSERGGYREERPRYDEPKRYDERPRY